MVPHAPGAPQPDAQLQVPTMPSMASNAHTSANAQAWGSGLQTHVPPQTPQVDSLIQPVIYCGCLAELNGRERHVTPTSSRDLFRALRPAIMAGRAGALVEEVCFPGVTESSTGALPGPWSESRTGLWTRYPPS